MKFIFKVRILVNVRVRVNIGVLGWGCELERDEVGEVGRIVGKMG